MRGDSPRAAAARLGILLPALLAVVGVGSIAFEVVIVHPQNLRFARSGRLVVGQVTSTPNRVDLAYGETPRRYRSLIFVDDPELGPQTVEVSGALPLGQQVPVLCVTPAHHCESADTIHERLALWPTTPMVLAAGVELVLAAILWFADRARRRSQCRARPP